MSGPFDAIKDPEFRSDVFRGLLDAGNRGAVAGLLGGPVDLMTMAMRPFGYANQTPALGSEWIGKKMQDAGLVSSNRNPVAEALSAFVGPAAAQQMGPRLFAAEQAIRANMAAPSSMNAATKWQSGMIKTPFGRIPETSKEIDGMADALQRMAERSGERIQHGVSNVSGSRYLTFSGKDGSEFQVRISNHGDRYPNAFLGGERFSVDPKSRNTFEMAKDWLKDNGVNLSATKKIQMPSWVASKPEYAAVFPQAVRDLKEIGITYGSRDFESSLGTEIAKLLGKL